MEDEECSHRDEAEAPNVVSLQGFAHIGDRKDREDRKRDDFLKGLELRAGELVRAEAIGGDLKAILEKRDGPACHNHLPQRRVAEFEMAMPRKGHENTGNQ